MDLPSSVTRCLIVTVMRSQRPLSITAGNFFVMSMPNFTKVRRYKWFRIFSAVFIEMWNGKTFRLIIEVESYICECDISFCSNYYFFVLFVYFFFFEFLTFCSEIPHLSCWHFTQPHPTEVHIIIYKVGVSRCAVLQRHPLLAAVIVLMGP